VSDVDNAIGRAESILPGVPAPEGAEDPRWQAIIDVGNYIESDPEPLWAFIARWGTHEDEDLRAAIATCLLEHLLDAHFDLIFPRLAALATSNALFADTFSRCWKCGEARRPENAARFDDLVRRCSQVRGTREL
jgi:hypothetical protein